MEPIVNALESLNQSISRQRRHRPIAFRDFLQMLLENPERMLRNVFQVFHDMVKSHVIREAADGSETSETGGLERFDCSRLFVEGADHPFFADRIFAARFIALADAFKRGAQQNKIYIFTGPPGCGKSTFLNNLLNKFEAYTHQTEGLRYETVWRIDRNALDQIVRSESSLLNPSLFSPFGMQDAVSTGQQEPEPDAPASSQVSLKWSEGFFEIACPSHDHPVLNIPKAYRRAFFDDLFANDQFKYRLSTEKEYEWIFKDDPCTICSSLFQALLDKLKRPSRVFEMLYARPYLFDRRLGEGISVFNPGDKPAKHFALKNQKLQERIDALFSDSALVRYIYSRYAKTNEGIYALMDIKTHNVERLIELHNIVSEGIHKVEDIEENVHSLFIAVMNPEDRKNIEDFQSFSDRIQYLRIPYVLDVDTEVAIYRNVFGRHIDTRFLPRVLSNFARVIIASRLKIRSEAMQSWISDPEKYRRYCDKNLQLLKMDIYAGKLPAWLTEEDRKKFTPQQRRRILAESDTEGEIGFSGRDAIKRFHDFLSKYGREHRLINMSDLTKFFDKSARDENIVVPDNFLESLQQLYDYSVLQEVKEALYYYNEAQISRDIQNYLFALNFEIGAVETCTFTRDKLNISEEFLAGIENRLLGAAGQPDQRRAFRTATQKEYSSVTLTREILLEGKPVSDTALFAKLHQRYVYNLKEKVLDPFLANENFRSAIKDYGADAFRTYDKRIRDDITFMINNLEQKFGYSEQGAKAVCIYVIDQDLARRFAENPPN